MAGLALVTPSSEPVTLAEAKLFAKIDVTDDDALVTELISAARKGLEERWNWSFVTQTWDYFLDAFPMDDWWYPLPIGLPRQPLQSVTSVKYTPDGGSTLTVTSSDYYVDTTNNAGPRVMPHVGKSWPGNLLRIANGVEVRIVTGYGAAGVVPEQLKVAVKQVVNGWYYQRDTIGIIPDGVDAFLDEVRGGYCFA